MAEAESAGLVQSWWYVRKAPCWRLRYLSPTVEAEPDTTEFVHGFLAATGPRVRATTTLYEPETHAFGGGVAMEVAHGLFHQDSRHILDYIGGGSGVSSIPAHVRCELSVMLCAILMRGAGQDWSEQGDIWARVLQHRPVTEQAAKWLPAVEAEMRRLLTVDAGPASPLAGRSGPLATAADWITAFHSAGVELRRAADGGTLTRGVRAILANHVIFHWNRMGLSYRAQTVLARTARNVILGD